MCNNNDNVSNCIGDILKVILVLQQNACPDNCLDSCDRPMLGGGPNCLVCNTRPVMLYTCCSINNPLSFPISKAFDETVTSPIFRIEKLDENCATFRVLTLNEDNTLSATNSFFTINLNCLCSLRCLNDTYIDCI